MPHEQRREDRRAENDPERGLCEIAARRPIGELAGNEFELAFNQREVGSRLIGLAQCKRVLICHAHVIAAG
jgi:hypothetical protein